MTGRALVFSNPEIARMATETFIPYAGDQWYLHRQQDPEGAFFWKVVQQGHRRERPLDETRQGIYFATAAGELLASGHHHRDAQRNVELFRTALERWRERPAAGEPTEAAGPADPRFARTPPEGGLVLKVYTRIPRPAAEEESWTPNHAVGRDHAWLTREEWRGLLPARWQAGESYPVPPAVAERLARFHLVDNIRGEPDMWTPGEIRELDMRLTVEDAAAGRLRLEGTARMHTNDPERRGTSVRLQGHLAWDRGRERFSRLDVLAWGEAWGVGRYTRGAPPGRFPLVIAFSLAGDRPADRIPPQGSRHLEGYLRTD